MAVDEDARRERRGTNVAVADPEHTLQIGDTLTVVSGRLGGVWMAEDDDGIVYTVAPVE